MLYSRATWIVANVVLQDHLDMLDSPERLVPAPREPVGHTLEFLPEDNSVIRVEGTGTKITRITKTKITIGDVVSRHESYTVHHGEMNNGRVLVYVVQLGGRVFQEVKDYVKQRDAELPLLIEHPRYIRCSAVVMKYITCSAAGAVQ